MKIGFIGTGQIAKSTVLGILKSNLKVEKIYISQRNKKISRLLRKKSKKIRITINNQEIINKSNWVFLSITPTVGNKILKDLKFKKQKMEFEPFISLTKHYKKSNPNTASILGFPCTQDTMLVFNSYLYHGHDANQLEEERIGLSWNGLINFIEKDKDLYRIRFVKET